MHGAHAHIAHSQPFQSIDGAFFGQDGVKVGQDLGGMLAPAIAAINDRHGSPFGGFLWSALLEVAHHDHIAVELEHFDCILDGLLVPVTGAGHLGIRETGHMPAQAVHGGFVRQAGAGGGLVESGHHGLLSEQVAVAAGFGDGLHFIGNFKDVEEFLTFEFFEGQNITTCKTTHLNLLFLYFG